MQLRTSRRGLLAGALGLALVAGGGSALAASSTAPSKVKLTVVGGDSFKPNAYVKSTTRFSPGTITIRSGGTVTLVNHNADPHTFSLVKKSDLPRRIAQVNNCAICATIGLAHGVDLNGPPLMGPPPHPVVDVGAAGFDQAGDSTVLSPKGRPGSTATFTVTAKKGSKLYFMCIIHPWMQGTLVVK